MNKDKQMDDVVERALYAFLKEDSAQMGEPFPLDWWESYKTKNPTEYAEYYASMKCALEAIGYQALVESEAKAQAEAKRLRELLEWQPFETAPKDGTRVLVIGKYGASTAHHNGKEWRMHSWLNQEEVPTHWKRVPTPKQINEALGDDLS